MNRDEIVRNIRYWRRAKRAAQTATQVARENYLHWKRLRDEYDSLEDVTPAPSQRSRPSAAKDSKP